MRHGKKINHLGRKSQHRKAMLSNMATSLILHKRINTTLAKAKALRKYVEPLINRSKEDTTHSRRIVFQYLQNKEGVKELFGEVSAKVATRPGGYTRILKTGYRLGDRAEMCIMELVDFNETYTRDPKEKTEKKRRTRRGGTKTADVAAAPVVESEVIEAEEMDMIEDAAIIEDTEIAEVEEMTEAVETEMPEAQSETEVVEEVKEEIVAEEEVEEAGEIKSETEKSETEETEQEPDEEEEKDKN